MPVPDRLLATAALWRRGATIPEVAERLGVAYSTAARYVKLARAELGPKRVPYRMLRWSRREDRALERLYDRGDSLRAIADQLGRGVNAIKIRVTRLGIAERPFSLDARLKVAAAARRRPPHSRRLPNLDGGGSS